MRVRPWVAVTLVTEEAAAMTLHDAQMILLSLSAAGAIAARVWWLNRCRPLLVRWERKAANHAAFLHLICALVCHRATGADASMGARR